MSIKETAAVEDYLKAILQLTRPGAAAGTSAIGKRLDVTPAAVTPMLKRLSEQALVEHTPYYGVRLTARGEQRALRIVRRHRVLELYLVQALGYARDQVHPEAERLEHSASDALIEAMARALDNPARDPHGAPIPRPGEALEEPQHPLPPGRGGRAHGGTSEAERQNPDQ